MIELDYRRGSGELEKQFLSYGIKVHKKTLEYGDVAWEGNGADGRCYVGVERKRIGDLIQSMQSQRLSGHQLRGISETFDTAYLLVEGIWKPGPAGEVMTHTGRGWMQNGMMTEAVDNHIMSLALRGGMLPWRTADPAETVSFCVHQYNSWQKKWSEHRSHDAIYIPQVQAVESTAGFFRMKPGRTVTKREEFAYGILTGLGSDKARWAARHFESIHAMVQAKAEEWEKVEWRTSEGKVRKIGKEVARKIVQVIRGGA